MEHLREHHLLVYVNTELNKQYMDSKSFTYNSAEIALSVGKNTSQVVWLSQKRKCINLAKITYLLS